ncbi:DHH family phosphoesterase [Croceivirga thetidis]|uniref:Bifunctional oligoribonuclease/PAP phosphatase NrnA n=1 Tax=Croceivirga thetidis TaxID=2721623 RepID=A0ABX1GVS4_9FLAO|nr:bifunctional oligoribonuclease/PAP phosphatase NrnA [Croceivirga thetidis]NKI32832.1 bifunctional oligoribonuclease/PAP phosphatase NrnA [Croceivirga thetidis]
MDSMKIEALKELLGTPKKIIIVVHKNPDGDAIGSGLGLKHFLTQYGHTVEMIVPNEYPKFLKWLPGTKQVLNFEWETSKSKYLIKEAEVIFTLDFNHLSRTGNMESVLENVDSDFVMIDHHQSPSDYASFMYSDVNMSSTCEMVYHFIDKLNGLDKITPEIAACLYTGIMTDTGSFKFASTSKTTHIVVADLIDKGAQNHEIHQNVFDNNSPSRLHLLGVALKNLVILEEYNTAFTYLTQSELDQYGYSKGDTEGFVNYGLTLEKIVFAVIFIENTEEGIIKISFRSVGDFSVNEFARDNFNGGGHNNAAGGRSEKGMQETIDTFVNLLPHYKDLLLSK